MIDLGALAFAPKRVGAHAAHLCVRNNFTTLECATLRGWGVAVEVFAARSARAGRRCTTSPSRSRAPATGTAPTC